jgi:hypothetical protein
MPTILGEIRAFLGLLGSVGSFRRHRTLLLERRRHFEVVLAETTANLDGLRRVWVDDRRFNWRGWLHGELLTTKAWHERKLSLTSHIDGGPTISDDLAARLDVLYDEFDSARSSEAYSSDWERRLVALAIELQEELAAFSRRRLNRLLAVGSAAPTPRQIDTVIRTPQTPAELQLRALSQLPTDDS